MLNYEVQGLMPRQAIDGGWRLVQDAERRIEDNFRRPAGDWRHTDRDDRRVYDNGAISSTSDVAQRVAEALCTSNEYRAVFVCRRT